jgi:hypothetical protein
MPDIVLQPLPYGQNPVCGNKLHYVKMRVITLPSQLRFVQDSSRTFLSSGKNTTICTLHQRFETEPCVKIGKVVPVLN